MRWCHLGVLQTSFVGIKYLEKADADSISKTVSSMLTDSGIDWQNKIVGIATDGAAVMMGVKNGVVARIKKEVKRPFIQAIHCSAHRLELAYKDACKKMELFNKIDSMMLSIYLSYKKSCQSIKFEKFIQVSGTSTSYAYSSRRNMVASANKTSPH